MAYHCQVQYPSDDTISIRAGTRKRTLAAQLEWIGMICCSNRSSSTSMRYEGCYWWKIKSSNAAYVAEVPTLCGCTARLHGPNPASAPESANYQQITAHILYTESPDEIKVSHAYSHSSSSSSVCGLIRHRTLEPNPAQTSLTPLSLTLQVPLVTLLPREAGPAAAHHHPSRLLAPACLGNV